ncbi:endoplasmic reticulum resident protein 44-like [Tubulanus polymorphus]|uniref:endoplasmic reticulum resident protein 44-like n=1 Tax=Tubulanus polymorphus TaxID=672921 RepID=UPI003DA5E3F2
MQLPCTAVKSAPFRVLLLLATLWQLPPSSSSSALQITNENHQDILNNYELVFMNFYADWCRFSQMLQPVFDEAAKKVTEEFRDPGKVVFAKVDCDNQPGISQQYKVSKYPTLKLVRHGVPVKKEYRGQRSAEALRQFIKEQLADPIIEHKSLDELDTIDTKKRNIIGYFADKESPQYKTYQKMASLLRDDCSFHALNGPASESERRTGNSVTYRPPNTERQDQSYTGPLENFDSLKNWVQDRCVPLVREITFENAEELTEEGLPFMILFYNPLTDTETIKKYTDTVGLHLLTEKSSINFLTADGAKFTHPLYHLGKSQNDLPVLAIDSFRHMYVFPHDVKRDIENGALMKQFIADLHSGKLHREFHHGPDPSASTTEAPKSPQSATEHIPKDSDKEDNGEEPTTPPESTFKKLAPSKNRYTLLRDEL